MQEQLQKLAVSKQEVLHCLGIVGAGFLYSLGINLFVAAGIDKRGTFKEMIKYIWPLFGVLVIVLLLVTYIPGISLSFVKLFS